MPYPQGASQPRLAQGCRWGGGEEVRTLLFPEGALRLQGTGLGVAELCDGVRTFDAIVAELLRKYPAGDGERIRDEAGIFLEKLRNKRIIDY